MCVGGDAAMTHLRKLETMQKDCVVRSPLKPLLLNQCCTELTVLLLKLYIKQATSINC